MSLHLDNVITPWRWRDASGHRKFRTQSSEQKSPAIKEEEETSSCMDDVYLLAHSDWANDLVLLPRLVK